MQSGDQHVLEWLLFYGLLDTIGRAVVPEEGDEEDDGDE
jgi:hypothetical protein